MIDPIPRFVTKYVLKHLGLLLGNKLPFNKHANNKISKATKAIGFLYTLQPILPYKSLLIIYKPFIRPHLDYGNAIYDQPSNASFSNKSESVEHNPAVAITGAIKGSSSEIVSRIIV